MSNYNTYKYNLLIDCSFSKETKEAPSSLEIYTGRLLQGLRNNETFNITVLMRKDMVEYWERLAGYSLDKIILDKQTKVTPSAKIDRIFRLIPFKKELQQKRIDIVLLPYFTRGLFLYPKKYCQHVVVHDLFYLDTNMNFICNWLFRIQDKLIFHKLKHVITISKGTQKLLKEKEGKDSDIIYNSIPSYTKIEEILIPEIKNKKYILDVNRFTKGKNAEVLIKAFSIIKDNIPHFLYLKGLCPNNGYIIHLKQLAKTLNIDDRILFDTSEKSDGEMKYLYKHADLFVTPSLKEGFGYTPIEAAILGTPVLISNIDVLKEVTCCKFPSFDPSNPLKLADLILNTIQTPPTEEERIQISLFFQKKYSLEQQINEFSKLLLNHKS